MVGPAWTLRPACRRPAPPRAWGPTRPQGERRVSGAAAEKGAVGKRKEAQGASGSHARLRWEPFLGRCWRGSGRRGRGVSGTREAVSGTGKGVGEIGKGWGTRNGVGEVGEGSQELGRARRRGMGGVGETEEGPRGLPAPTRVPRGKRSRTLPVPRLCAAGSVCFPRAAVL